MNLLRGTAALVLICANTVILCVPLFLMGLLRAPCRGRTYTAASRLMDDIVDLWTAINRGIFALLRLTRIHLEIRGDEPLDRNRWYVVISNHQSWSDILILQNTLWRRIPLLKFFTKQQLIWIPFVGLAMWLLGFPYVRRAGREQIARNPQLLEQDRAATIAACARFRAYPTSVLNFLEGTRFTAAKRAAQQARFEKLLNPKLGGLSYVIAGLEDRIHQVVDVTIAYPGGIPTFWDLLQGRCREVEVLVQCRRLPDELRQPDSDLVRERLGPWIETLWREKDLRLGGGDPGPGDSGPGDAGGRDGAARPRQDSLRTGSCSGSG
jgi:1-acyl-sn-glycerol-3-phosphate acyltransferase